MVQQEKKAKDSFDPYAFNPYTFNDPYLWHTYEVAENPDASTYGYSAISAMSDRPARLGVAPPPNGYKNEYGSFAQARARDDTWKFIDADHL